METAHLRAEPCYNIRIMKTIAIHLRLATASHRKRMMGIFRFFGSSIQHQPGEDNASGNQNEDPVHQFFIDMHCAYPLLRHYNAGKRKNPMNVR